MSQVQIVGFTLSVFLIGWLMASLATAAQEEEEEEEYPYTGGWKQFIFWGRFVKRFIGALLFFLIVSLPFLVLIGLIFIAGLILNS